MCVSAIDATFNLSQSFKVELRLYRKPSTKLVVSSSFWVDSQQHNAFDRTQQQSIRKTLQLVFLAFVIFYYLYFSIQYIFICTIIHYIFNHISQYYYYFDINEFISCRRLTHIFQYAIDYLRYIEGFKYQQLPFQLNRQPTLDSQ